MSYYDNEFDHEQEDMRGYAEGYHPVKKKKSKGFWVTLAAIILLVPLALSLGTLFIPEDDFDDDDDDDNVVGIESIELDKENIYF